ncbi:mechanosensitive ion channel domain-containing protein [Acidicapsa dinghuensis]|uniref:Mechanosensitive ion channel domain-containing protein n=1 Tax=Acidicapsa dinghuensis TaxID=2218256 RepID=A0ABW1EHR0_9BACT|nr:mechanosensitive ion channel family protein [Acidicapsa dinghuensis]
MATAPKTDLTNDGNKRRATKPLFGRWALGSLIALCLLIVIGVILLWQTNGTAAGIASLPKNGKRAASAQKTLVDESPWDTAKTLTALAITQEELTYAREAERLADHDVDQAFAAALRAATLQQKQLTGAALEEQQRVKDLQTAVASDQQSVQQLTPKGGNDLDVAKAQLGLDQDELSDAQEDLARASGDQRGEIQQELTAREADMKRFDASQATGEAAVVSVHRYRTLAGLIGAWQKQNQRYSLLVQARDAASQAVAKFGAEHDALEKDAKTGGGAQGDISAARVAGLNWLSLERQLISIYDDRVDTEQRLASIYDKWATQVEVQHKTVLRLILIQTMWIFVIVIAAILLDAVIRRITEHELLDPRRLRTLSGIFRLAIQLLAFVAILLVIFGAPSQISTVIGLTTAGLTVALQDFILGFVGWFILMGKGGNAVGDVVEIDGVAGEVVEIGLFRTTLLETGNWTAKGHPTGRRVAFNNKYAISGKFFNFTTAGQWMWDELTVTIPLNEGTHDAIERVQTAVAAATRDDAEQADREWKQAANSRGLTQFSAQPAVNLRPSGGGVDVVVRYVTKATERFDERNRINQGVLDALRAEKEPVTNEQ